MEDAESIILPEIDLRSKTAIDVCSVEHLVMCFDAGQKPTEPESLKNRYFLNNSKLNIIRFAFYFGTFWKKCTFNSKNKKHKPSGSRSS